MAQGFPWPECQKFVNRSPSRSSDYYRDTLKDYSFDKFPVISERHMTDTHWNFSKWQSIYRKTILTHDDPQSTQPGCCPRHSEPSFLSSPLTTKSHKEPSKTTRALLSPPINVKVQIPLEDQEILDDPYFPQSNDYRQARSVSVWRRLWLGSEAA